MYFIIWYSIIMYIYFSNFKIIFWKDISENGKKISIN